MAARKKAATQAKAAPTGQLPEGYRRLNAGFAASWEPEVGDVLEGEVTAIRDVEMKRGRKTVTTRAMEIEQEDGSKWTLWESALLNELFEQAQVGSQVFVMYEGVGKSSKAGQNPPKMYTSGIATDF